MDKEPTGTIEELISLVKKLRSPEGCSWDRKQTVSSLRPFMLEEAYEVADASETEDWDMLKGELGDLLLHVVMAALICEEDGLFTFSEVIKGISDKLIRRHPHVFDETSSLSPEEVEQQWETIKSREKKNEGFFNSIPGGMPALQMAWRIQQRAAEVGFDWPDAEGALAKVHEEFRELEEALSNGRDENTKEEMGDVLFSMVNYCRLMGFEPENMLRMTNRKFIKRFTEMERIMLDSDLTIENATLEQMEEAWQKAKSITG